jgi:2-polyprenyl-3-methyl-5-hydroxy-6-metoxy-1,4-benzoquinol methylase
MANIEKFWDFLAKNFDQGEGNPADREDIPIIQKYLRPSDVVLDYACGTGTLSIEIANHVKEICAVDISSKMLAVAQSKAARRKIENIHFEHTTLFDTKFQQASFDVVLAFNILHLLEDARQAVQRINELLKPGGLFISNTPCLGEEKTFINRLLFPLIMASSKIGVIPYVRVFKTFELEHCLADGNFQMAEVKKFSGGIFDYFIVARKIDSG